MRNGIDVLLEQEGADLRGMRVGLITNPSGVTAGLESTIDALRRSPGVSLAALFAPEHGLSASVADGQPFASATDRRTGLPIYSLYHGQDKGPTPEMLRGLDALVLDIQDVGARFYTFISSMVEAMTAVAECGLAFIVLDRPNPISGTILEGPILDLAFQSFIGCHNIPIRHGLTMGELARLVNQERSLGAKLTVIPMAGWRREMWFDETGLPWVPPSPAMPNLATATLYPGMCLLEGTNVSEGRGTALPFQVAGAPWVDGYALAEMLNRLDLPGVRFRPSQFRPAASKWLGQLCEGVQVHVRDRQPFRAVRTALHIIAAIRQMYLDQFAWRERHFDLLMGSDATRLALDAGRPLEEIVASWETGLAVFARRRESCLIYAT